MRFPRLALLIFLFPVGCPFHGAPPHAPSVQETAFAYRLKDQLDKKGYALYSCAVLAGNYQGDTLLFRRYRTLLRALRNNLLPEEATTRFEVDPAKINLTQWPLKWKTKRELERSIASPLWDSLLVAGYDYDWALALSSSVGLVNQSGPFLVTSLSPLNPYGTKGIDSLLIVNMTDINEAFFPQIVLQFKTRVKEDPETWQGHRLSDFQIKLRNFFEYTCPVKCEYYTKQAKSVIEIVDGILGWVKPGK